MQLDHALPYFEAIKRPFTYDCASKVRDRVIADFRKSTKQQFLKDKQLFNKVC